MAALGGCGGLGQLWEALAELREALGELLEGLEELWEALYIDKLPINRTSGRYVYLCLRERCVCLREIPLSEREMSV